MANASPRTDTSTDVDTDDKNQRVIYFSLLFIRSLDALCCIIRILIVFLSAIF